MTKEQLRNMIGENIRRERIARGMSIDELAEVLELTPGFVGLIERGRRGATALTLHRLSQAFDISLDIMFVPSDKAAFAAAEGEADNLPAVRKKVSSMVVGLSKQEMKFLVSIIKGLRTMNHAAVQDDDNEED